MKRLDHLLGFAFDQREIIKAAKVGQALRRWNEIVGEDLAQRSWPDRYDSGIVYVAATGSAWAQELRMQKATILDRFAKLLHSRALVLDVRFGVRPLPARPPATPAAPTHAVVSAPEEELSVPEIVQRILARAKDDA